VGSLSAVQSADHILKFSDVVFHCH
jgi:hypothetical protein